MKKILIISPHFPPSNLTSVHRARFFAQHFPSFGWEPIILTVHEKYYEEVPDYNLEKLLPPDLKIEKVRALKVFRPRILGDIGLRAFYSMYKKAKRLIKEENIDFVYITIPSFYGALWGRWLHKATGIPYGIDYIDPWVHVFPGKRKRFSRSWLATVISRFLEPIAVKKASLITGVAESYYHDVIVRNPALTEHCKFIAIPYGSEKSDYEKINELKLKPYLFEKKGGIVQMVYAGAMLPKAFAPLEAIFSAINNNSGQFQNLEFHFIGTGKTPNDPVGYNIKPLAEKYGLWENVVFEYPKRIPYLDVLVHLNSADGIFILGSTESHYTPSKVYQGVLSGRPILAVLHQDSTGLTVIRESNAGLVLDFNGPHDVPKIERDFPGIYHEYLDLMMSFQKEDIDHSGFENYSASKITHTLSEELDNIIDHGQGVR